MSATAIQTLKNNEFGYNGNPLVKRDGVEQSFTQDELKEYIRCMNDPSYFARKYVKVISLDQGLVPFDLYPYQERMFTHFNDNRFSIVLACRQSGKSISSVVYILWYAIFKPEQTIAVLANKGSTAQEMIGRITLALENLPFFLQPGCKSLNRRSIEFSNNSRIVSSATSGSSIRGMSVNLLFLDEFAFVENDARFYTSTYPVVTAGKSTRVIITSTANGIGNVFHKIWEGAVQSTNDYKPFRVDWWDVPGRDEEWKRSTIANTSELQFDQEFGNNFHGTGNTLINANTLLRLKARQPIYAMNNVNVYETPVKASKNEETGETNPDHQYMMFVDVSKGRGQDYSTFNMIDITARPFRQVATFRDNMMSPLLFPDVLKKYARLYNNAIVVIENNDQGAVVCNGLYYDLEYENTYVSSTVKADGIGVFMDKKVKKIGCSNIKDLVEQSKIEINDADTIVEMSTFVAKGQSYEASANSHDDLMMNLVLFGWFATTPMFVEMLDSNMRTFIYAQQAKQIEDEVLPFGFIEDGREETVIVDEEGQQWNIDTEHLDSRFTTGSF
jgi:hypothetical protein